MTSVERHEARYQRRKAKRNAKALELGGRSLEEVCSFGNLCEAGKACCNGSRWKTSTINFETNLLAETQRNFEQITVGPRKFKGFRSFATVEHGKMRNIDALPIQDREVQKCLCKNLLVPVYSRSFIYDNSASLRGKGMQFQLNRLKKHLHDHYRKYGTEGGIYQMDFKNYFGSIPHEGIKNRIAQKISDPRLQNLICSYVDDFCEMGTAMPGEHRGIGLGSEISQIIALDYASPIDHYIKDVCGIHGYGRYNDDGYVISNSIAELESIRETVYQLAENLGIRMNERKNTITPFHSHGFTFLKMRFRVTEHGKVLIKISRKSRKAMGRKLGTFRRKLDRREMRPESVFRSYQSWRAYAEQLRNLNAVQIMDKKFTRLFAPEHAKVSKRRVYAAA